MSDTTNAANSNPAVEAAQDDAPLAPPAHEDASSPAPSHDDFSARTPRLEDHTEHEVGTLQPEETVSSAETDYFGNILEGRRPSSGFLVKMASSSSSSPQQSNYASSASLHSSSEHASGEMNAPYTAEPAFGLNHAFRVVVPQFTPHAQVSLFGEASNAAYDYPHYPDQSLAALQHQNATLPRAYLQSRSSEYWTRQTAGSTDRLSQASWSVSADHTPLQSPGLFQPRRRVVEQTVPRSERGPSLLHPTHHARVTKETNKLIKDFDSVTGNKIMNDYEVFEKLGVGSHGAVKRARNLRTGEDVAIKIVRRYGKKGRLGRYESPEDKVRKEVAVLKQARHPHVVSLLEVIDDPGAQKVYLVLEYVKLGEIIWRTETSRDVARFEMGRIKRELSGSVDDGFEADLATIHNVKAKRAKLQARKKLLARRQRATERTHTWSRDTPGDDENRLRRLSTIGHHSHVSAESASIVDSSNDRHWSNEVGGNESDTEPHGHIRSPSSIIHCPPSASLPSHSGSDMGEGSIQDTLVDADLSLLGSQYGAYSEDDRSATSSDFDLSRYLNPSCSEEEWTLEENSFRYVPCMTMTQVRDAFRDTVLGLEYLHYQGIIHRDIKPANLLWTEDYRVKISDFGVSHIGKPIRDTDDEPDEPPVDLDEAYELAKTVGTPAFYAPELCDPDWFNGSRSRVRPKVTGQIDVWALGVSLYAMIYGRLPFFDDNDEFAMYEKIARQEAFLSSYRFRGVDENGKVTNSNKRSPEMIEYEPVDGILKDLLKRLLLKDPAKRITLREVKRHPWVLQGLEDPESWINETDPSIHSEGKKIEVSNKDVEIALAPLNLVDRIKHGIRRLGSVVRGRDTRRRAESNAKDPSGSNSSRSTTAERDGRRPSLRGDEQISSAWRALRETADLHPLSHSVVATPVTEKPEPLFTLPNSQAATPPHAQRPPIIDRSESTTDSVRTLKPTGSVSGISVSTPSIAEEVKVAPQTESAASSSSGLSGLIGVASRRLRNSMRSRDRGSGSREHSNTSSQASSSENIAGSLEDRHGHPSVALSRAVAAGQVENSLPFEHAAYPDTPYNPSPAVVQMQAEMQAERQQLSSIVKSYKQHSTDVYGSPSYIIRDDEEAWLADNSHSSGERLASIGAVSSDDQIALSESYSNPSIPSTSTSTSHADKAGAMLATADTIRAASIPRKRAASPGGLAGAENQPVCSCRSLDGLHQAECRAHHHGSEEDEAGYHGDGDGNSDDDDDDDGIIMMSKSRR